MLAHDNVMTWKYHRTTAPLWGKSDGHWWTLLTKSSDAHTLSLEKNAGEMGRNLTAYRLLNAHILGVGKDATCKRSEGVGLPNPCQLLQFITDILGLVASQ